MVKITKQQIPVLVARLVEFQDTFSSMSKEDGQWMIQNISEAIKLCIEAVKNRKQPSILRLISEGKPLVLKGLKGNRLISEAFDVFKSFIDGNFINLGLSNLSISTPETPVQVHEMLSDGKLMEIFSSLPGTWNQKCLSQDQVIDFCETLPGWLHKGDSATFFLIKKDENKPVDENKPENNLVVVDVYVSSDGLSIDVGRLEDYYVWDGEDRHRVVSPQLLIPLDK